MQYYQEITILPSFDIEPEFLMSRVFYQLHLGFVGIQDDKKRIPIGVSFPAYSVGNGARKIGNKCRLFAQDLVTLQNFKLDRVLDVVSEYASMTKIQPLPLEIAGYAIYQRKQPKVNKERLARRNAKRHARTYEEAVALYEKMPDKISVNLPYIKFKSLSTRREFCLWIEKLDSPVQTLGSFNTYGLSREASLPEF